MFRSVIDYITSSVVELRHVTWPSRREVTQHTIIIIVSVIIAMIIIAGLDYLLELAINHLILKV